MDRGDALRLGGLLAALLVVVAIVLLAGGGGGSDPPATGQVRGILISVTDQELVLQPDSGGDRQTYKIRPQDRQRLDLFHLQQHSADRLPSILYYERSGDTKYATRVDDA
jgi:hypothetical protein